jgi:hypothetical protein
MNRAIASTRQEKPPEASAGHHKGYIIFQVLYYEKNLIGILTYKHMANNADIITMSEKTPV